MMVTMSIQAHSQPSDNGGHFVPMSIQAHSQPSDNGGHFVPMSIQAHSQPSDNGGHFPRILGLFQDLKIGVPSGCLWETLIFIIMTDDVSL